MCLVLYLPDEPKLLEEIYLYIKSKLDEDRTRTNNSTRDTTFSHNNIPRSIEYINNTWDNITN